MPQQYHSLPDTMYTDYRQPPPPPPPPYQDNYALMYSHSNFQHYHRSAIPSAGSSDTGHHDYGQQYYHHSAASNSYGLMPPSYNTTCNISSFAANNFHASSYSTANFHPSPPTYSAYDNIPTSPITTLLTVKTEPIEKIDHSSASTIGGALMRNNNSPIESHSDRSECSFTSSKLDVCSKSDDTLTDLPDNIVNNTGQECNMENSNIYQSCGEENVSSKLNSIELICSKFQKFVCVCVFFKSANLL